MSTHTDAWIDLARQLGRDAFRAGHPGFFLVSSDALGDEWTSTNETRVIPGGKSKIAQVAARALEVRWIGNVQDATADRISVGRGRQCDISFRHPSVSALHAHFAVDGGVLALTDAGSRNGTFVNGERLASGQSRPVRRQDRVQFGEIDTLVLDANEMFDLLSRLK